MLKISKYSVGRQRTLSRSALGDCDPTWPEFVLNQKPVARWSGVLFARSTAGWRSRKRRVDESRQLRPEYLAIDPDGVEPELVRATIEPPLRGRSWRENATGPYAKQRHSRASTSVTACARGCHGATYDTNENTRGDAGAGALCPPLWGSPRSAARTACRAAQSHGSRARCRRAANSRSSRHARPRTMGEGVLRCGRTALPSRSRGRGSRRPQNRAGRIFGGVRTVPDRPLSGAKLACETCGLSSLSGRLLQSRGPRRARRSSPRNALCGRVGAGRNDRGLSAAAAARRAAAADRAMGRNRFV